MVYIDYYPISAMRLPYPLHRLASWPTYLSNSQIVLFRYLVIHHQVDNQKYTIQYSHSMLEEVEDRLTKSLGTNLIELRSEEIICILII